MKKLIISITALTLLVGAASAQNYNAFKDLTGSSGITVTQSGDIFTITLNNDPTVSIKNKTSNVKDITGFWLLDSSGQITATPVSQSGFQIKTNSGGGTSDIGWFTQNKTGLLAGQSESFKVTGSLAGLTGFGFMLHANGVPAHVQIPAKQQPVPEPASMAAMLIGAVSLLRRKKSS